MSNPAIIILFNLICGTTALMYGVNLMGEGLEKNNTKMIKKILTKFTSNVWKAFITGTLVTALVQSSTAITVMTVGFVNAGLMLLPQAIGIIYGANIGTTITAQLMSFNLTDIAFPALVIGFTIAGFSKKKTVKNAGLAIMGFSFMFIGLRVLNSSVPYIKESKEVYNFFRIYGQNIYIGLFIGMLTTMLVHSSSATVGLTIVLFNSQLISFESAIGLTLGDNIGTCITAQLASLQANIAAKRTAWAHTLYNIIGVFIALIFLYPFTRIVEYITLALGQDETYLIANTHTIFNILSAILFLPITKYYVKFIVKIIPEPLSPYMDKIKVTKYPD
jgi:phosphate:Na+ symporter